MVGCTIGSREVPGERKPMMRYDDDYYYNNNNKVKEKLSLCLTKHHTMKAYWGLEV
jgi:hypothetical protein